jgi:hypothetical protein
MKTTTVCKASPMPGREVEDATLVISANIDEVQRELKLKLDAASMTNFREWEQDMATFYRRQRGMRF